MCVCGEDDFRESGVILELNGHSGPVHWNVECVRRWSELLVVCVTLKHKDWGKLRQW